MPCSRKSARSVLEVGTLIGHLTTLSRPPLITIAGPMVIKWYIPTQATLLQGWTQE
jgi:hypothetical protein